MDKEISKHVLFNYFAGKATPKQKRQIEVWLSSSHQNQETFFQWMEEWERKNSKYDFDVKGSFAMLKERILASDLQDKPSVSRKRTNSRVGYFWQEWKRMAAVFLLLSVATAAYFFILRGEDATIYQTGYGEIQTIVLPDQSTVRLNANSRLTFSDDWKDEDTRQLWLEGEAFFSVVHTENDQKFVVHSNNVEIEVLGTEFNVNSRHKITQVVLNSGKVKLNYKAKESVMMVPGELVEYAEGDETFKRKTVNPGRYTSWRNNQLIFKQTPLHEVIQLLEDNYGLKVVVTNKDIRNKTFTATLPTDDAEVVLKALSKSFKLTVRREDHQVILAPDR